MPSHNHSVVVGDIVGLLRETDLPVFLIDDGSDEPTRSVLADIHDPDRGIVVHRFDRNQGKGGAVIKGFELAAAAGFTHAVQVDADGQHDLAAVPRLLAAGTEHPQACIVGSPVFDRSMPLGRRIGRWITHFWVSIETLTPRVIDSMCGFRLYPLDTVTALLHDARLSRGMDFDTDILVRLIWLGVEPVFVPVAVTYPAGNISNFHMLRDNWRITRMHTVLVLTMLTRLPQILRHKLGGEKGARHWSAMAERGGYWGLFALAVLYRLTGRWGLMVPLALTAVYFHITGREQRRASRVFLERAFAARGENRVVTWRDTLRHSFGFAVKAAETFIAWMGGIDRSAIDIADGTAIEAAFGQGQGALIIVSHLGNPDLSRALFNKAQCERLTVLIHTRHAQNYMNLLRRFRPEAAANTIQVADTNPGTIIALQQAIESGQWIAIAGDRTPIQGDRVTYTPFLGHSAPFPQGPYMLAYLLGCPVYLMTCLRERGRYHLYFEKFADRIELPRGRREAALGEAVARYAQRLEAFCLKDPFQWYNFFDFWAPTGSKGTTAQIGTPGGTRVGEMKVL